MCFIVIHIVSLLLIQFTLLHIYNTYRFTLLEVIYMYIIIALIPSLFLYFVYNL